jgi:FkbM family methyltransferase
MRSPDKIECLSLLRDRGLPVGTVLDVGVCYGTPELKQIWPNCKHVLFEPVEEFQPVISRYYSDTEHELHQVAVGDEDGLIGLKVSSLLPGMDISHSKMVDQINSESPDVRPVKRVRLDTFTKDAQLAKPFLLKIDVDGQELAVLRGARDSLRYCSIVIVECQAMELAKRISLVQSAGFTLFDLCEPCYYDKVFWQCDAVFIRNDFAENLFERLKGKVTSGMYERYNHSNDD